MSTMSNFSKKARSIFYIVLISGLLSLTSFVIEFIWNNTFIKLLGVPQITFLESVGIVAFVYVIYFGIKFGQDCQDDEVIEENETKRHTTDNFTYSPSPKSKLNSEIINNLPQTEKQEILEFVSRCCGIPSAEGPDHSSFRRRIEHIKG
jgi:hypothetical protein